jgi:2-polyprenyl-6-methoxyphenol hydroxylase-like FAD-dependent oxidoreductase
MDVDSKGRVLIAGGGIGGLTAAIALQKMGIDVAVFEASANLEKHRVGGGIHLWHNGIRGLQQLDLAARAQALGGSAAEVERAQFATWQGEVLAEWPVAATARKLGAPTIGVSRPDLHGVLTDAVGPDVLQLGRRCTGFEDHGPGGVTVRFLEGREETGALLLGADGLRSAVRGQLHGPREPRFAGYASWQAIVEFEHPDAPVGLFKVSWGPGARFLWYRLDAKRVYWEGQLAAGPGEDDPEGHKLAAVRRFRGWASPIEAILEATPEAAVSRLDVYDRPGLKRWGAGRVTLLGDAAHPMTNAVGQGANQAIEDGVVLAKCLAASGLTPEALREYESRRVSRTATLAKAARFLTAMNRWHRPSACWVRQRILKAGFNGIFQRKQNEDMAFEF